MKNKSNLHTHTTFSDGKNSMEEMIRAAISKGFVSLGISDHAPSIYEADYALPADRIAEYRREFFRLKEKYRDKIQIYLGIEMDALSDLPADGFDYVIGSVHNLLDNEGNCYSVDHVPEAVERGIRKLCGGDEKLYVYGYFDTLCSMAEKRKPDIIGHMDLFMKLNGNSRFFDVDSAWYRSLCADIAARIAAVGRIVEVNTALAKYPGRNIPYPSPFMLTRLAREGVSVTLTSDSHHADTLDFWFDEALALLKHCGFRAVKQLHDNKFIDLEI